MPPIELFARAGFVHGGRERIEHARVLPAAGDGLKLVIEFSGVAFRELVDIFHTEQIEVSQHRLADVAQIAQALRVAHRSGPHRTADLDQYAIEVLHVRDGLSPRASPSVRAQPLRPPPPRARIARDVV